MIKLSQNGDLRTLVEKESQQIDLFFKISVQKRTHSATKAISPKKQNKQKKVNQLC